MDGGVRGERWRLGVGCGWRRRSRVSLSYVYISAMFPHGVGHEIY